MTRPPNFDLSDRVALVTGASSGIGRRFATLLAASGAKVVLAARRAALLADLKSEIEQAGGQAVAVPMDVADEPSTIAAFDAAQAAFGTVDTVIVAREGARRMVASGFADSGRGRVVLIGSITGQHSFPGIVPYGAAKAAVTQMGRLLAKDWATKGINVNVLAPGYMATDMTNELWEIDKGRQLLEGFARQRLMPIDALDAMLLFLCSDASAYVTGGLFTVDDGQTL